MKTRTPRGSGSSFGEYSRRSRRFTGATDAFCRKSAEVDFVVFVDQRRIHWSLRPKVDATGRQRLRAVPRAARLTVRVPRTAATAASALSFMVLLADSLILLNEA